MATRRTPATRRSSKPSRRAARPTRRPVRRNARPWTKEEIQFMRKYYRRFETSWIARQLGRSVYSVRYKAVDLNIKKAAPSVWKGNRGAANAFNRPTARKASTRRTSTRRPSRSSSRGFRASSMKRTARTMPRRRRNRR